MNFYETFKFLCDQHNTTPTAVTRELGYSNATASHWKNGMAPRTKAVQALADYFSVTTAQMLGFDSIAPETPVAAVRIPVLADVAAGIPIDAICDNDIDDWEELPDGTDQGEYFALRIKGDSMAPRMQTGDVVIVHIQPSVEDGEIAIVGVNGDCATCKRVRISEQGLFLCSLNPAYEPMFYSNAEIEACPVRIYGKVVELRAKFH